MLKNVFKQTSLCLLVLCLFITTTHAQNASPPQAAVASAHPLATQAGLEILTQGGNAFDAAVAITATLAVVEPTGSGLGGGGFWLLHRAKDGFETMIDGREVAPMAATETMYQDQQGNIIDGLSLNGPLAAGIPGSPAALAYLAEHYGRLPLARSLAPAIRAAQKGFQIDQRYLRMAGFRLKALRQSSAAAAIFLDNQQLPKIGFTLKQPDLANTLLAIAKQGKTGFYQGDVAKKLVDGVRTAGGIWTLEDLAKYKVIERAPIKSQYKGMTLTSASPPSSGGIAMATTLNILENFDLDKLPAAQQKHLIIEAMRRAYRDRAEFLGDPDFVDIPTHQLLQKAYAKELAQNIQPNKATPSSELPGIAHDSRGQDTSHFSVLDTEGNRVAATLSINFPFGAAFVAPGTGVLLNDEMDDFSSKPGSPNKYGLVGAAANAIAPGKRPLSSMSPSFFEHNGRIALIGTPGGSRIITMVLLAGLSFYDGLSVEEWVAKSRYHHQYLPDVVTVEPDAFTQDEINTLTQYGHQLKARSRTYGNMQSILWDQKNHKVTAASDPRGNGQATVQ